MVQTLEKKLAYDRKYREEHREQIRARIRIWGVEYRKRSGDKIKSYQGKWRAKNKQYVSEYNKMRQRTMRDSLIAILGGAQCAICQLDDYEVLQIDHIHNNGYQERKVLDHSYAFYKYYTEHPEDARVNLQVLCANCNWRKRNQLYCQEMNHKK